MISNNKQRAYFVAGEEREREKLATTSEFRGCFIYLLFCLLLLLLLVFRCFYTFASDVVWCVIVFMHKQKPECYEWALITRIKIAREIPHHPFSSQSRTNHNHSMFLICNRLFVLKLVSCVSVYMVAVMVMMNAKLCTFLWRVCRRSVHRFSLWDWSGCIVKSAQICAPSFRLWTQKQRASERMKR